MSKCEANVRDPYDTYQTSSTLGIDDSPWWSPRNNHIKSLASTRSSVRRTHLADHNDIIWSEDQRGAKLRRLFKTYQTSSIIDIDDSPGWRLTIAKVISCDFEAVSSSYELGRCYKSCYRSVTVLESDTRGLQEDTNAWLARASTRGQSQRDYKCRG
ncbi:hypothetical protein PC129_g22986 [Phytophthora cactorum]|uniref:Uncharacterized protein n=1 Tax=Phytophthora cactorum TaxID=29920 RepID=A0A329RDB2_9STRA|nr:hypothetical protein Pcac1_g2804 [Phytophthora cactorum]KAG2837230.1 hypothetical protein PC113_g19877 [Phytophthora cactorum]KAG2877843.1 hypothetical protein PC115_g23249 [Phytophthora cactorum]KAG2881035.1 hypothetical protein PC114_g21775 [Phytophthora cactorum]KAG2883565.1 hypothetical protein PC117_g25996 [Phytophthora cactorum]